MSKMNAGMAMGMMAQDPDVAFVCSMIPHHQGAIDMAKAELEHGDDPWAKEMAAKVICGAGTGDQGHDRLAGEAVSFRGAPQRAPIIAAAVPRISESRL